jgi:outer membrane receptor for ferrienterochelin and colicin
MSCRFSVLVFLVFCLIAQRAAAQDDDELVNASLEELLKMKVDVASNVARPVREQPGIISIITAEDIRNMGARTLEDVLRFVPGMDIEYDYYGLTGIVMRGLWSQEGKVLLEIDGRVYNDPVWGNLHFSGRFSVENIRRIEIIRGPGSVQFGPYADLAVIRITTKGAELDGVEASILYGHMDGDVNGGQPGQGRLTVSAGKQIGDLELFGSIYGAAGIQTDDSYVDYLGVERDLEDASDFLLRGVNLGARYKGFEARFIADAMKRDWVAVFGFNEPEGGATFFEDSPGYYGSLSYELDLDPVTIRPEVSYTAYDTHHLHTANAGSLGVPVGPYYDTNGTRFGARISALYELNEDLNFLAGFDFYNIAAEASLIDAPWSTLPEEEYFRLEFGDPEAGVPDKRGKSISHQDYSVYAQTEIYTEWVNITAGIRYDKHTAATDPSIVPRLALTRVFGDFHVKALYANAFRMGDLEPINQSQVPLRPEKTRVIELEAGYQINENMAISANVFNVHIDDPITWFIAADGVTYTNKNGEDPLGSTGFEVEYRLRGSPGYVDLAYSYYQAEEGSYAAYISASNPKAAVGAPQHKFTINTHFRFGEKLSLNPSIWFISERHARLTFPDGTVFVDRKYPTLALVNIWLTYELPYGFSTGLGVFDLLNNRFHYVGAYDSPGAPYPGRSREFLIRLTYRM